MEERKDDGPHVGGENAEQLMLQRRGNKVSVLVFIWCFAGVFLIGGGGIPEALGGAFIPFIIGWGIAKLVSLVLKRVRFETLWFLGATLAILITLFGRYRAAIGI